jgi:hypothetical protein
MDREETRTSKEAVRPGKGAIKQFIGCVLLFLGGLNTMLTLKGAMEPDPFNYFLMVSPWNLKITKNGEASNCPFL